MLVDRTHILGQALLRQFPIFSAGRWLPKLKQCRLVPPSARTDDAHSGVPLHGIFPFDCITGTKYNTLSPESDWTFFFFRQAMWLEYPNWQENSARRIWRAFHPECLDDDGS